MSLPRLVTHALPPIWHLRRATVALSWAAIFCGAALALWGWSGSRLTSPEATRLVLDPQERYVAELLPHPDAERGFWPVHDPQCRLGRALVAIEDRRFAAHPGIDLLGIARASWQNLRNWRRISGASTIAMQVVRLQQPARRSYRNKLRESVSALLLTARHGRSAVLGQYLRLAPFGNRIRGGEYAARIYLEKPLADLSWAEAAFLAALPQAPGRMSPYRAAGLSRAKLRAGRILDCLQAQGQLDESTANRAQQELLALTVSPRPSRPPAMQHLVRHLEQRQSATPPGEPLPHLCRTTVDAALTERLRRVLSRHVQHWSSSGVRNGAVLAVNLSDGAVLAWVGSTDYFGDTGSGSYDYTRVPRSPGSVLKPFFYGEALDRGVILPSTWLRDAGRGAGGIANSDERALGLMLPRQALATSRNVPAAEVLERLGLESGFALLTRLGLGEGRSGAQHYGLGVTLGGMETTMWEVAQAATVLGNDGRQLALRVLASEAREETPIWTEDSSRIITSFLSDPQARLPIFQRNGALEYPYPAAVKTGTSSDFRDVWTVAYTPRHLVAVWLGDPDQCPLRRLTGAVAAAPLAREALTLLTREAGTPPAEFPAPKRYRPAFVSLLSGQPLTSYEPPCVREYLSPAQQASLSPPPANTATDVTLPPPELAVAAPPRPRILFPSDGAVFHLDPESPPDSARLLLRAEAPADATLVWQHNGQPFASAGGHQPVSWQLRPGNHEFSVEIAYAGVRSSRCTIVVR